MKHILLIILLSASLVELAAQSVGRPSGQRGNRASFPPKTVTGKVIDC